MNLQESDLNKLIEERIKEYLQKNNSFTSRKPSDTPTDDYQLVPRKYVTMNGVTANRPRASVIGQSYYDTTINKPVWWTEDGCFKDAAGNVV